MDIDIVAYPSSKGLEQKAPRGFSNTVIALAFEGGGRASDTTSLTYSTNIRITRRGLFLITGIKRCGDIA